GQLSPANETDLYSFNAQAGDRFYFDFLSVTAGSTATWRLLDPFGNTVFGPTALTNGDVGLTTLPLTGSYTLLVEGKIDAASIASHSFNAQPVPTTAKIILSGLGAEPGPDLIVRNLAVTPTGGSGLVSGAQVVVSYEVFNAGDTPTSGTWLDRLLVRNTS